MKAKDRKRVVVFGTFDLLHDGHKHFFREARKEGDKLFVVVARDDNVKKIKGRLPHEEQEERIDRIRASGLADEVYLGKDDMESCDMIIELQPDVICLGYDQNIPEMFEEKVRSLGKDVKIVRIDAHEPHVHKSSIIRKRIEESE
jgi:cytidyltransferase-like protein